MKSQLVPKQITDKNGVISTRWVKPEKAIPLAMASFPAPTPAAAEKPVQADPESIEQAAVVYVNEVTYEEDEDDYVESTLATAIEDFSTYPAVMVDEIKAPASNPYQKMWSLKHMMDLGKPLENIRDLLNLSDFISSEGFEDEAAPEATFYDFGGGYEGLDPVSLNEVYPHRRRQQLEALIGATSLVLDLIVEGNCDEYALGKADNGVPIIANEELRDLFINRPEDSAVVLDFMRERKTVDYSRIVDMLESMSPAIASGEL